MREETLHLDAKVLVVGALFVQKRGTIRQRTIQRGVTEFLYAPPARGQVSHGTPARRAAIPAPGVSLFLWLRFRDPSLTPRAFYPGAFPINR